jgi:hypothetical protein
MVAESGYSCACGVDRGIWGKYNMWRVECHRNDSMLRFFLKLNGVNLQYYKFREESIVGRKLYMLFHKSKVPNNEYL